ncbi:MAG: pyridoxal phosphate-dependent aminotransferase [Myxococcota bacterium]
MPRPPHTAPTAASLSSRVFSGLTRRAAELEASGKTVHRLSVGDTYKEPLPCARAENQTLEERPGLHRYAPPRGEPALLAAVARRLERLHTPVDLGLLQIVSGATSGLSNVASALLSPGDEVLLPSPYWPLIRGIIAGRGATAVEVPAFLPEHREAFLPRLEAALTERTVALYLNSPHNPTGAVLSEPEIDALAHFAEAHDLWVIADEAYQDLYFGEVPPRVWTHPKLRPRAVVCHTLSKSYGIAGSRIGYVHGPAEAMAAVRGVQTFSTYCAPRPLQFAAAQVLDEGDAWLAERRAEYSETVKRAAEQLEIEAPPGGTFFFADMSAHMRPGEDDVLPVLERVLEGGVLLTPGHACGKHFTHAARICFTGVPPSELDAALTKLKQALA